MKRTRIISILMIAVLSLVAVSAAGCSGGEKNVELPAYKGDSYDLSGNVEYNNDLFRRNDKTELGPDPFVLDDRERSGYFWGYSTNGYCFVYRSPDLTHWEPSGTSLGIFDNAEHASVIDHDVWAPEVLWDKDLGENGKYVMFFSASSDTDDKRGNISYAMFAAVSDSPAGPFKLVDFSNAESCYGAENVHTYDTEFYSDYFTKYLFFNPEDMAEVCPTENGYFPNGKYYPTIDPHPYIDPIADPATGEHKKYLFFSNNVGSGPNVICSVEMENWLKPKWDTYKEQLRYGYYTVEDYENKSAVTVPYERDNVNEGAFVYYNSENNLYYLTFSTGGYGNASYSVAQAVSNKVDGPYRKLTMDENAVFLSGGLQGSEEVSGTGHHTFMTLGSQLYIIYHRHNDFYAGGGARNSVIDEVKFITAIGPDGKDLQVMYTNGPSTSLQPQLETFSEYTNIAGDAKISGGKLEKDSSFKWLNDGLLSCYQTENLTLEKCVGETFITQTSTITLEFEQLREIRAVMVYNSKNGETAFRGIKRIEILAEDGKTNYCILDVPFPEKYLKIRPIDNMVTYVSPCSASITEFNAIKTKRVRVTVEIPEGQEKVGISEIKILGKAI